MVLGAEPGTPGSLIDRGRDRPFDGRGRRQVLDAAAARADEVVVVPGEILRQLVPRKFVTRHHAMHHSRFLEHDEVAIHRALCEPASRRENLGDRQRAGCGRKDVDDAQTRRREALRVCMEQPRNGFVQTGGTRPRSHRAAVYEVASPAMDATEWARRQARAVARKRFGATVTNPAAEVRLDVAAFCIAAHAHPGIDIDAWCARLDELAAGSPAPTFDGVRTYLFEQEGFTGNTHDYSDPENSFLDSVLTRRTGIPITLAVLMIEIGRRLGVDVRGVGMPGHFLVQDGASAEGRWCDPFHGGAQYNLEECRALFARLHGSDYRFHPAFLAPSSPHEILGRMLANLEHGRMAKDPLQLAWMCELHLALPGLGEPERTRLDAATRSVHARWN